MPRAIPRQVPSEADMPTHLRTFRADEWPTGWRPAEPGEDDYAVTRARYGRLQWEAHRRLWMERQEGRG